MHYTLRVACACCFIGHGAFGIITKPIWCNYFAVLGIGHDTAYRLMPLMGTIDLIFGLMVLLYPIRLVFVWLVIWGLVTALLRPLSGEPFAEFIERAGNFGAPLALLLLSRLSPAAPWRLVGKDWWSAIDPQRPVDEVTKNEVQWCLRVIAFLLLLGHGWLNLLEKKGLIAQYSALGFTHPANLSDIIGIAEIAGALWVFIWPARPLLVVFLLWKVTSELFYPHYALFEWIERGGSYGVLLALLFSYSARAYVQTPETRPEEALGKAN